VCFFIKLEVYRRFVIDYYDGVHRFSDEKKRRRDDLDAAYKVGAVEATAMESRLRAYFEDSSIAAAWHTAWDLLANRYVSLIVIDEEQLKEIYARNATHLGLSAEQLADRELVFNRYWELRGQVTDKVVTYPMRHGA
jgi:hypothetical protein